MQWKNIPICKIHGLLDIKQCIPSSDQRSLATREQTERKTKTEWKQNPKVNRKPPEVQRFNKRMIPGQMMAWIWVL